MKIFQINRYKETISYDEEDNEYFSKYNIIEIHTDEPNGTIEIDTTDNVVTLTYAYLPQFTCSLVPMIDMKRTESLKASIVRFDIKHLDHFARYQFNEEDQLMIQRELFNIL